MGRLSGRVAIVTGAGSLEGLGATYALALAAEGARLSVSDIVDPAPVVDAIKRAGGEAIGMQVDVTDAAAVAEMVRRTVAAFSAIQVLVNNAARLGGPDTPKPLSDITSEQWDRMMAVNTRGPFECIKAVLPVMRRQHYGKIINIASSTFFSAPPGELHYVASKGAVIALTRAAARELGGEGIAVNCVAPGLTLSGNIRSRLEAMSEARARNLRDRAFKRDQVPEDLVGTVIFLASADSDFITGQTILVDGGAMMH
ncbi:MAG TPA: SDR family oxidoreductase [Candidatus Binataceae bacterium]|nr:SDR family oxidoreductase [Candidatus Binataceae bacterium]